MLRYRLELFLVFCLVGSSIHAASETEGSATPNSSGTEKTVVTSLGRIGAVQLKLSNGMTVCLKPTDYETNEVQFKLGALGGFGALPDSERSSGQLSAPAAWESGMGGMTSDQVSVFLYEHALEFEPKLLPFSRTIEGRGTKDGIEYFLQCVQLVFTKQAFTKEGWQDAIKEVRSVITKAANDFESVFEADFIKLNTQSLPELRPLRLTDIDHADFDVAKDFFHRSFSDPAEFYCIIVGNFDSQEVIKFVEKYLGAIPKGIKSSGLNHSISAPFPEGTPTKTIHFGSQRSSLVNLTFPLQVDIQEGNINEIAFICQVIEARLKRAIADKMELTFGVDVAYEFPVYPYLNNPWITIRFRCEEKDIIGIKGIILSEIKRLQTDGVEPKEVKSIKKLEMGSQSFWLRDNFYLVSMLMNYYLWGWNPERVDYRNTSFQDISQEKVEDLLKRVITLTNYSVMIALPAK